MNSIVFLEQFRFLIYLYFIYYLIGKKNNFLNILFIDFQASI